MAGTVLPTWTGEDAEAAGALDAGGAGTVLPTWEGAVEAGAEVAGGAGALDVAGADGTGGAGAELLPTWDGTGKIDGTWDSGGAGTELVFCDGATHRVQMVLVLVIKTVEMLVVISTEVVLP